MSMSDGIEDFQQEIRREMERAAENEGLEHLFEEAIIRTAFINAAVTMHKSPKETAAFDSLYDLLREREKRGTAPSLPKSIWSYLLAKTVNQAEEKISMQSNPLEAGPQ
jgi:hypothetical protein